jgi:hypothetical protein
MKIPDDNMIGYFANLSEENRHGPKAKSSVTRFVPFDMP